MNVQNSVFKTILLYSICEFQSDNASIIHVEIDGETVSIQDDGRGHSLEREVDGVPYLQLVYEHLSWPFDNKKNTSIQLQALGISLCKSLCDEFTIQITKTDVIRSYFFVESQGCGISEVENYDNKPTGNKVTYKIRDSCLDDDFAKQHLTEIAEACPTLSIVFNQIELS